MNAFKAFQSLQDNIVATGLGVTTAAIAGNAIYYVFMRRLQHRAMMETMYRQSIVWRDKPSVSLDRTDVLQYLMMKVSQLNTYTVLSSRNGCGATTLLRQLSIQRPGIMYISLMTAKTIEDIISTLRTELNITENARMSAFQMIFYKVLKLSEVLPEESVSNQWDEVTALYEVVAADVSRLLTCERTSCKKGGSKSKCQRMSHLFNLRGTPQCPVVLLFDDTDGLDADAASKLQGWAASCQARGKMHILIKSITVFRFFGNQYSLRMEMIRFPDITTESAMQLVRTRLPGMQEHIVREIVARVGVSIGDLIQACRFLEEDINVLALEANTLSIHLESTFTRRSSNPREIEPPNVVRFQTEGGQSHTIPFLMDENQEVCWIPSFERMRSVDMERLGSSSNASYSSEQGPPSSESGTSTGDWVGTPGDASGPPSTRKSRVANPKGSNMNGIRIPSRCPAPVVITAEGEVLNPDEVLHRLDLYFLFRFNTESRSWHLYTVHPSGDEILDEQRFYFFLIALMLERKGLVLERKLLSQESAFPDANEVEGVPSPAEPHLPVGSPTVGGRITNESDCADWLWLEVTLDFEELFAVVPMRVWASAVPYRFTIPFRTSFNSVRYGLPVHRLFWNWALGVPGSAKRKHSLANLPTLVADKPDALLNPNVRSLLELA